MLHPPIVTMAPVTRQAAAARVTKSETSQTSNAGSSTSDDWFERMFWSEISDEDRVKLEAEHDKRVKYLETRPDITQKNKEWRQRLDSAAHRLGLRGCR